ncbi:quaternary ammonium compound efflux SMR transporter SugE [Janthinobacterium sp. FT14W]|uniref:DMT family transporter n=1 Tax=Janthinobacterium sp. FT14W TaxID=2654253 RepID=UPI001264E001|nr:quaternary ammonium compound efflux SMR transporter SugE [Janthinobacterium sp. FT14W]KAB8058137.1 quaternary ammonium compound efflux SMR transporter SugE [Janthinobacterium sp. FT14W]
MAWILLLIAGMFEVVWAYSMKLSEGFTKLTPSIITIVMMIASFGLLSLAMRTLPLGTAYTIWTGIGAVGAFIVGVVFLGEQLNAMRVCAAVLIVSGIVLMKMSSSH